MTDGLAEKPRNRILAWVFVAAMILLGVGWVCYVPHHPERILRMIPHNAALICLASDLDTALDQLKTHPALARLEEYERTRLKDISGAETEADADVFSSALGRPEVATFMEELAGEECALVYVPRLSDVPDTISGTLTPEPAWIAYSWIGAKSQAARTILTHSDSDMVEMNVERYGNIYWHTREPVTTDGRFLSFTLFEGIIAGCLSRDKHAIKYVIQTADLQPGYPTVMLGSPEWSADNIQWPRDQRMDYWINWQRLRKRGGVSTMIKGTSTSPVQLPLVTTAEFNSALNQAADIDFTLTASEVPVLLGDDPDAVFLYSRDAFWKLFGSGPVKPAWLSVPYLHLYPSTQASSPVFVAAFSEELNGRLLDLHVPSVIMGIRLGHQIDLSASMGQLLDRYNKSYQLGVIPVDDGEYVVIEGTRENGYGQQKHEHAVASIVIDDWLLLGSDFSVLKKLVSNYTRRKLDGYQEHPAWLPETTAFFHSGWLNMERGGASLRRAASAYGLTQAGSRHYRATIQKIDHLSSIIETASVFEECSYVLSKDGDICAFSLKTLHPEAAY